MSVLPPWTELALIAASVGTAGVAIGLFMRSTRKGKVQVELPSSEVESVPEQSMFKQSAPENSSIGMSLKSSEVERARKELNLLALERDVLSMVIAKFFEAEDEGEISGEDRARLSKEYEARMQTLSERMKRSELIVGLYELEKIRNELVKRFESKLNEANAKIEEFQGALKLATPKVEEEEKKPSTRTRKALEKKEEEETEAKPRQRRTRGSDIDEKIEKLRQEVLKELEELEKLEIEA